MTIQRRELLTGALAAGVALGIETPISSLHATPPTVKAPAQFRLGTVTYNAGKDWNLPTLLRVCKTVGLAAVELRTTHKHGVEPTLSADARKEVRQRFSDSGVVCWGTGSVCEFHSTDASVVRKNIETCKTFVELTAAIGGKGVKVRPNGLPRDVPVDKTLEQIGKALVVCGNAAQGFGVEIWVEVHGGGTQHPVNMKKIMEHCGHPNVGVTWNSNGTDLVNKSVKQSFELLKRWIRSCHINDLYNDASKVYPYRELFSLLREMNYDRYTLCEVGRTPPTVEAGIEFFKYYRALWLELTTG